MHAQLESLSMSVQDFVDAIVTFVRANEGWAGPVAFVVAFLESFCFLSILWPGTAILIGISALLAQSGVEMSVLWPAIIVGWRWRLARLCDLLLDRALLQGRHSRHLAVQPQSSDGRARPGLFRQMGRPRRVFRALLRPGPRRHSGHRGDVRSAAMAISACQHSLGVYLGGRRHRARPISA